MRQLEIFGNYKAWSVNEADFPQKGAFEEKIKFVLQYAVLAPSTHNSQPWLFRVADDSLKIYRNPRVVIKEADREGRMLFLSLGCCMANIRIAANHFGMNCLTEYNKKADDPLAAFMVFSQGDAFGSHGLFSAIPKRRSNRNEYEGKPIPASDLEYLKTLNEYQDIRTEFVVADSLKGKIREVSGGAMAEIMAQRNFRRELAGWLRNNPTFRKTGMPGFTHGMSLIVSFLAPFILRTVNVSKVERAKELKRFSSFSAVAIVSSKEDSKEQWMQAGEALEKILLGAEYLGLSAVIRAASIESPESRAELQSLFDSPEYKPQIVVGLGYAKKPALFSPRKNFKETIIKEK